MGSDRCAAVGADEYSAVRRGQGEKRSGKLKIGTIETRAHTTPFIPKRLKLVGCVKPTKGSCFQDNVTLCGQSAGGACADLLALSPRAKGTQ